MIKSTGIARIATRTVSRGDSDIGPRRRFILLTIVAALPRDHPRARPAARSRNDPPGRRAPHRVVETSPASPRQRDRPRGTRPAAPAADEVTALRDNARTAHP